MFTFYFNIIVTDNRTETGKDLCFTVIVPNSNGENAAAEAKSVVYNRLDLWNSHYSRDRYELERIVLCENVDQTAIITIREVNI